MEQKASMMVPQHMIPRGTCARCNITFTLNWVARACTSFFLSTTTCLGYRRVVVRNVRERAANLPPQCPQQTRGKDGGAGGKEPTSCKRSSVSVAEAHCMAIRTAIAEASTADCRTRYPTIITRVSGRSAARNRLDSIWPHNAWSNVW